MNAVTKWLMIGCAISAVLGTSGCATTTENMPPVLRTRTLSFDSQIDVPAGATLRNQKSPEEYVIYCLSLAERGRHDTAADFLMDGAGRFSSRRNELALSMYAAAANEYFLAGNMEQFRTALWTMQQKADRYQAASFDEGVCSLLALADIIGGESQPKDHTPRELRDLYKLNAR